MITIKKGVGSGHRKTPINIQPTIDDFVDYLCSGMYGLGLKPDDRRELKKLCLRQIEYKFINTDMIERELDFVKFMECEINEKGRPYLIVGIAGKGDAE